MRLELIEPLYTDYWYEQKLLEDPKTMNYNAGFDINWDRYDYKTGCISFPESLWKDNYKERKENNNFFGYLKDKKTNFYIGTVNYQLNKNNNRYECGLLIEAKYREKGYSTEALKLLVEHAFNHGVKELYDDFEDSRIAAVKIFTSIGFKKIDEFDYKKFNKSIKVSVFKLKKEDYYENN